MNNNNNNKNMNPSNKNHQNKMNSHLGNSSNPTIINNYYYNKNHNRNRNNNKKQQQSQLNQIHSPKQQQQRHSPKHKQHIIIRSTNNPDNMRIIPISNSLNPYSIHSNILKSLMENGNHLKPNNVKTVEEIEDEIKSVEETEFVELKDINNLDDLIRIGEEFNIKDKRRYSIDMNRLKNIIKPLKELRDVIGMESVKTNIFEQLIFLLQELNDNNMMHTVIDGPPGVGKTLLGKILAKIYCKLKFLKGSESSKENDDINNIAAHLLNLLNPNQNVNQNEIKSEIPGNEDCKDCDESETTNKKEGKNEIEKDVKFKIVRRSDLIGQYVGSTAIKTQRAIDEALGGVLFIDEVYALGTGVEKHDTFAKEAIDCINQNLSENGDKFICIIAGYPDEIEKCFFSQNVGLKRRFPFKYSIEKYNSGELAKILEFKINEIKWKLDENLKLKEIEQFIEKNKDKFKNFGGDIDNLLLNIKIKHSLRIFGKDPALKKIVTMEDIKIGYDEFTKTKKNEGMPEFVKNMYL
jgi:hypothetical protein